MTEKIDLGALEVLARKATPGPWEFSPDDGSALDADAVVVLDEAGDEALTVTAWIEAKDAEFIAAVNPSVILALIAELRRARDTLEAVTAERDKMRDDLREWEERGAPAWVAAKDAAIRKAWAERDELRKVIEETLESIFSRAIKPTEPVPELFPGVAGALDDLTIWKDKTDE